MKKGQVCQGTIERVDYPDRGTMTVEGERVSVRHVIPGQVARVVITKKRNGKAEGRILEILQPSPLETASDPCPHFGSCGGCAYQTIPYEAQLEIKERQLRNLLDGTWGDGTFEGIKASPARDRYRNKMEFSFGDERKGGPLALGMHKRGSFYDVVNTGDCRIVDRDFCRVLEATKAYFEKLGVSFYKKMDHLGYLRHLLVRRAVKTGEILVDLVTTTQESLDLAPYVEELLNLELSGRIVGILHTWNDSLADVVQNDRTDILHGQDYFYEELLGLKFKITPFSFFQTNTLGAEVLYETVREYLGTAKDQVIFDLYSGTGTIAQVLAPKARKVVGVELVQEAVDAARENAKLNGLDNCRFIQGDVLKAMEKIEEKPDLIILDPPRDGIHPKALKRIMEFGVERMVYVSCKPTSLVRDLVVLRENGYRVLRGCGVDMFPGTGHVESIILMTRCGDTKK